MSWLNRAIWLLACSSVAVSVAFSAEVQIRGPKTSKNPPPNVNNRDNTGNTSNRGYVTNSDGSITLLLDSTDSTYGPITSNDTLWQIAGRYKGNRNLSVYQAMYAIYQRNPNAFEQDNLNLLKNGFVLELPSESDVARINKADAQMRFERDKQRLLEIKPDSAVRADNTNTALTPAQNMASARTNVSKSELDETKQLIEQKLGALDEAQTRHFMAIRQQFAESINNVQAILTENQKLAERLDKVNADIDQMREQETIKTQQMTQMGQSIEELLNKSREQEQAQEQALEPENESSWLDNPLLLIGATSMLSLSLLGGFAYWLLRRKSAGQAKELHIVEDDDIELDSHNSALDDLSDALSSELSDELGEEIDDDNLFGDEDLLDDVLAEELGESLDEALDEPFETELDNFDDVGDELLDNDELSDEFEVGTAQIEQSELDNLFDEDDDLAVTDKLDTQVAPELIDNQTDTGALESQAAGQQEPIEDEDTAPSLIAKVGDEDEPPEISIEELFDGQDAKLPQSIESDDEEINEEMLQQLDKEIAAQNAELDNITGSLLDELEQVEQMRDLMGDLMDDDDEPADQEDQKTVQPSIQKLDEDALAEGFDANAGFEPDFLDVLDEEHDDELVPMLSGANALDTAVDDILEPNSQQQTIETLDETVAEAEVEAEPETASELEVEAEPETTAELEVEAEPEPTAELEVEAEPEPAAVELEVEAEPELTAEREVEAEPEPTAEREVEAEPELTAELEVEAEPELTAELEIEAEPEPTAELEIEAEPELTAELEAEPELEVAPQVNQPNTSDDDDDEADDINSEQHLRAHANDDHGLDEDQLEKALEDFEHQELEAVLEDLTSNKSSALDTLDDLEFGMVAEDFVQHQSSQPKNKPTQPDEHDDALLDKALAELDAQDYDSAFDADSDELDDLPGLGDWLGEPLKANTADRQKSNNNPLRNEDESLLDALEEANFDELLSAMDLDDEEPQDSELGGLDIGALLSEQEPSAEATEQSNTLDEEEDFLDVEALLNDSYDEDNESPADRELDLSSPLASFFGDSQPEQTVDVDSDSGVGAKLDLAHAYIEIGENESAVELLEDIIETGNEQQKAEAQNILNSLSTL